MVHYLEAEICLICAATTACSFGVEQLAEGKGRYAAGGLVAAAHASCAIARRIGVGDGGRLASRAVKGVVVAVADACLACR